MVTINLMAFSIGLAFAAAWLFFLWQAVVEFTENERSRQLDYVYALIVVVAIPFFAILLSIYSLVNSLM